MFLVLTRTDRKAARQQSRGTPVADRCAGTGGAKAPAGSSDERRRAWLRRGPGEQRARRMQARQWQSLKGHRRKMRLKWRWRQAQRRRVPGAIRAVVHALHRPLLAVFSGGRQTGRGGRPLGTGNRAGSSAIDGAVDEAGAGANRRPHIRRATLHGPRKSRRQCTHQDRNRCDP